MFWNSWLKFRNKKQEDIVTRTIRLLNNIKHEKIDLVYSSDYSVTEVTTLEKNIVSYTNKLKLINGMYNDGYIIHPSHVPRTPYIVYVRDFFTDTKGYYIDTVTELERFIEETKIFMRWYFNLTLLESRSFEQDKIVLNTQHIFNNLVVISESI